MRQLVLIYYLIAAALLGGDDRILRIGWQVIATPCFQALTGDDDAPAVVNLDDNGTDDAARKRTKFTRTRTICDLILVRDVPVVTLADALPRCCAIALTARVRPLFTWFCLLLI